MNRNIIIWPDGILRLKCSPVTEFNDDLRRLLADMGETMVTARGAGLAAPQVGFPLRAVVVLVERLVPGNALTAPAREVLKLVNPHIVERSNHMVTVKEACLSLPGFAVETQRHAFVRVEAQDENGAKVEVSGDGQLAIALQHELEHLDGRLLVDKLSPLKREMLSRQFIKAKKRGMRYVFPSPEPKDFTAPN